MSAVDVGQMLVVLGGAFGRELTDVQARVYISALAGISPEKLAAVTDRAVREARFFPTISELLAMLAGESLTDAPVLVWMDLRRTASDGGQYAEIVFEDVVAAIAFEEVFGDWPSFCALEEGPALGVRRQEFIAAYYRARSRPTVADAPVRLQGLVDRGPAPIRIGAGPVDPAAGALTRFAR